MSPIIAPLSQRRYEDFFGSLEFTMEVHPGNSQRTNISVRYQGIRNSYQ